MLTFLHRRLKFIAIAIAVQLLVVGLVYRKAVAAATYAITEYAVRFIQTAPGSLPPQCATGNDCVYVSNVDGHVYHKNTAGSSVDLEGAASVSFPIQNATSTNTFLYGGTMTGTSIAESHNATNAYTTGDIAYENKSAGSRDWFIGYPASATIPELRGAGDNIGMRNSSGTGPVVQGANDLYLYGANAINWHMLANNYLDPAADNTYDIGQTARVRLLRSARFAQGRQSVSFSATPAFNCTTTNFIHFGPVTANITGPTMTAGIAGERCTIVLLKDGTATTYTVSGWGSNVRVTSTFTFSAGANSLMVVDFIWDDTLGTPAWVQTHAAVNDA